MTVSQNGTVASGPTVQLRYRSRRALDADYAAYLVHGGMLIPAVAPLPEPNYRLRLEILAPELCVGLSVRVERAVPGQGFLVSFDPQDQPARRDLDAALESVEFGAARDVEPEETKAPEVSWIEPEDETTDPNLAPPDFGVEVPEPSPRPPPPSRVRGTSPLAFDERRLKPDAGIRVRRPHPGETYKVVLLRYPNLLGYLPDAELLETTARFEFLPKELQGSNTDGFERGAPVRVKLTLPGHHIFEMWAVVEHAEPKLTLRVDSTDEQVRRACLFPTSHPARNRREREQERAEDRKPRSVMFIQEEMPDDRAEKMPLRRRIQRMGMEDKINLALSGNREERMALAQDSNRSIHHYLLKNAKLTVDEVAFMARLPSLNPDVLDKIAENPSYTQNPQVTKALVFNPRTPIRTAIRLLDRLPRSELNVLSRRTGMNKRLVVAAKNKMTGSKW